MSNDKFTIPLVGGFSFPISPEDQVMTLRDYFAAKVMVVLLSETIKEDKKTIVRDDFIETISICSYRIAEGMMQWRNKVETEVTL